MTRSKAHQRCAFISLLLAIVSAATVRHVPSFIATQHGIASVLLAVCAFGHFNQRTWAYRLTQGVSLLILLGGFAALLAIGSFGLAVLPNILLLWLMFTNQQTRPDWVAEPPSDSTSDKNSEPLG